MLHVTPFGEKTGTWEIEMTPDLLMAFVPVKVKRICMGQIDHEEES